MKYGKITKSIVCFLLTVAVLLPGSGAYAASEERIHKCTPPEEGEYLSVPEPEGMDTNADWDRAFNLVFNAVYNDTVQSENADITVDISSCNIPYTDANIEYISNHVFSSPELFAVSHKSYYYSSIGSTLSKLYFSGNPAENKAKYAECEDAVEQLLYEIKGNNALTDVDKCLLLHDRLVSYCEYDYANYLSDTIPDESYDAYGALVKRTAVCNGYALAYMWLLDELGIENYLISSEQIQHAFTRVIINSEAYYSDTTWDDPVWDVPGRVKHENFMLSFSAFSGTHKGATDFSDDATSTVYEDYFSADSKAQILYINGSFYYLKESSSNSSKYAVYKRDMSGNESEFFLIDRYMSVNTSSYSWTNYDTAPKIINIGNEIIYTCARQVRSYNVLTNEDKLIYTPSSELFPENNYRLIGLRQIDGKIYVTSNNATTFDSATVSDHTESFVYCNHSQKETLRQTEGNCRTPVYKTEICKGCHAVTHSSGYGSHIPGASAKENVVPSTCTEGGHYDNVVRCTVCRNILNSETIITPPSGHSYSISVTPPTCTASGYTTHACHCGDSYTDSYKNPLGHSFTNYKYNGDATPERDGTETAKCDRCSATDTRIKEGTKITNPTYAARINVRSSANISYRSDVTVTATADNVPAGYCLAIYDGGTELATGTNSRVSYHVGEMRSNRTFTVKIIDANKTVQTDLNNNLLQRTIQVNVNSGFFARIIAWFRSLFGSLPKEEI